MKKYYVSYVVECRGYEGGVREEEFENLSKCFIDVIEHFSDLDDDFEEDDYDEKSLEEMLNLRQSENCGEWRIVSIIEEGKGVVYTY